MAKKSLHIGINAYPYQGAALMGCINDAKDWSALLTSHYGFSATDITLLTDADATKRRMIDGIKTLLTGVQPKDVRVFTYSGHGTYIADVSGDDPHKTDEALCPYDLNNLLLDDELQQLFLNLPAGVRLTVVSDSCFSGTVTRALLRENFRVRFLSPALRGDPVLANPFQKKRGRLDFPQASMNHVLVSGCTEFEYSFDAKIGASYHGAGTYYMIKALETARYRMTYTQLQKAVNALLTAADFPQHPCAEGPYSFKRRFVFT